MSGAQLLLSIYNVYVIVVVVRCVFSFIPNPTRMGAAAMAIYQLAHTLTEPLLAPLRKLMEPIQGRSGLDFSPMVLLLLLQVGLRMLLQG